jgi:hypothetical protein
MLAIVTILMLAGSDLPARSADTQALEHVLDQWATAWSCGNVETLGPLFTDNVEYEDVTFGAQFITEATRFVSSRKGPSRPLQI